MLENIESHSRDPKTDHLLTPQNSALVLIDYQPSLIQGTNSIERDILVNNAVAMAKVGIMYDMPIILSTIMVESGFQEDTVSEIKNVLAKVVNIDRTHVNAWEEPKFREAIKHTGCKKLIMAGLWTEVCLAFPVLDLLQEGYEVYALSDVSGGTTIDAHERSMQRLIQAGAVPVTWEAVMSELGRLNKDSYDMNTFVQILNEHVTSSVPNAQLQLNA